MDIKVVAVSNNYIATTNNFVENKDQKIKVTISINIKNLDNSKDKIKFRRFLYNNVNINTYMKFFYKIFVM